jgi:murein L,D-transpeptidase YafK
VKDAYNTKYEGLKSTLEKNDIAIDKVEIFIVGYKKNKDLEIWARNKGDLQFKNVLSYKFCALSGDPGPKRMQGDMQVPEGFYHINVFNPWSNFHLSMGINYPNKSDRILGVHKNLGGDIYIHGFCVTIGCIPITDKHIKELYVLCLEAKNNGQLKIPVNLFPARLDDGVLDDLIEKYDPDAETEQFWSELQIAYDLYQERKTLPRITFKSDGTHLIQ